MAVSITQTEARKMFLTNSLKPLVPYVNANTAWKSQCLLCKKIVFPNYSKVRERGHQCGYCAGTLVDPLDAVSLMKDSGLRALVSYPGSHSPWKCICIQCKREVTPTYSKVRSSGTGCKFCSKRAVDLDEAFLLMLKSGVRPKEKYRGAMFPWKCECLNCGKTVNPTYSNVRVGHNGCRFCAYKVTEFKRTKTKTEIFDYLKREGYTPIRGAVFVSSEHPIECKHLPCGRRVKARYFSLQQGRGCCNYCGTREGAKKLSKTIDEVQPILKKKGITLLEKEVKGMKEKHRLQCRKCNLIWSARLISVTSRVGCPNCALYGMKPNLVSYIYLIEHKKYGSIKLGIANSNKSRDRVDVHMKKGWEIYKIKTFTSGVKARRVETECLKYFRKVKNLLPHLSRLELPQGGWTETFDAKDIKPSTIWAKVEELSKVKR